MSKKKNKKKSGPPQPLVRLSQCMIVKNEEKNIEKALSWAKGIAFEQIVVDTGSTDKTVEIARKMGAKIYNFEWINDFGAAKNFAIEQATGDWIAFLDADEYFSPEDAKKLMPFLKHIRQTPELKNTWLVIQCPWVNIDEYGETMSIMTQERLFRNIPSIRYVGKIHERLSVDIENTVHGDDIAIIHTGYSRAAYAETNKVERNIDMLKTSLEATPDDLNLKSYLADAIKAKIQMKGETAINRFDEVDALFREVINGKDVLHLIRKKAYLHFPKEYIELPERIDECENLCIQALKVFPDDIDFEYFHAAIYNRKKKHKEALELLQKCKKSIATSTSINSSEVISANPELLEAEFEIAKANS
ncbi:MAG: glycosyltransferase family 2 protein [Oscillospiraceae bacterium]|jgi:glycosyltransferase involved in cell wall biosynthesis|nr:glycosyltransferase family 2 protein [Oscillospiraceae bacterium]